MFKIVDLDVRPYLVHVQLSFLTISLPRSD